MRVLSDIAAVGFAMAMLSCTSGLDVRPAGDTDDPQPPEEAPWQFELDSHERRVREELAEPAPPCTSEEGWLESFDLSQAGDYSDYPDIEADAAGNLHVVWNQAELWDVRDGDDRTFEAYYLKVPSAAPLWPAPRINLSNQPDRYIYSTRLAVDRTGQPHVVWMSRAVTEQPRNESRVEYTTLTTNGWNPPLVLTEPFDFAGGAWIAAGPVNDIHVTFRASMFDAPYDGRIYHIVNDGLGWSDHMPVAESGRFWARTAVDSQGSLFAAWVQHVSETLRRQVFFAVFDGATWSEPVKIPQSSAEKVVKALVVDRADTVHLLWGEGEDPRHLFRTVFDGESWLYPEDVTPSGSHVLFSSLVFDAWNRPHVVFMDLGPEAPHGIGDPAIWYTTLQEDTWTEPLGRLLWSRYHRR